MTDKLTEEPRMRLDAATLPLPIERERGIALLWSVTDLVQPALDLARTPGQHTAADLATAIFNGGGDRFRAVHDAITAVEALNPGYGRPADAARANLDAWFAALPFTDATPLPGGAASAWARDQANVGLRHVIALAGLVAPGGE